MAFMAENPPEVGELFFGRSGGDEPVVNYVARLDGVSQYWQLSEPVNVSDTDDYKMTITLLADELDFYAYGSDTADGNNRLVFTNNSGQRAFGMGFNNSPIETLPLSTEFILIIQRNLGLTEFIVNGDVKTNSSSVSAISISRLGGRYDGSTSIPPIMGHMKNFEFELNGIKTIEIPLTNKDQGATQQPTIGAITATMINFSTDVWERN